MSSLKREDLLGYVLGALDAQEQQRIQQLIDQDAKLGVNCGEDGDRFSVDAVAANREMLDRETLDREMLDRETLDRGHPDRISIEDQLLAIKNALAPLELIDTPLGPPPGLARRTCQWIAANERSGLLPRPQTFESASELLLQQVADDRENYWISAPGGRIADRPTGLDAVGNSAVGNSAVGDGAVGNDVSRERVSGEKVAGENIAAEMVAREKVAAEKNIRPEHGDKTNDPLIAGRSHQGSVQPSTAPLLPENSTSQLNSRAKIASSSVGVPHEPTADNSSECKYNTGVHNCDDSRTAAATANQDSHSEVSGNSKTDLSGCADAILTSSHPDALLARDAAELNSVANLPKRAQSGALHSMAARSTGRGAWQSPDRLISRSTLSLTEMVALCTAALVVGSLLLPTLSLARFQSRVGACQENMLSLHRALMSYAVSNPLGEYVRVFDHQKLPYVGNYAVVLNDFGFLEKAQALRCPGLGDDRAATPVDLTNAVALKPDCSHSSEFVLNGGLGDYGYTMGVKNEKGKPMGVKPQMPNRVALVADSPSCREADRRSLNHEGRGQNTLYNDGSIGFRRDVVRGVDHLYLNDAWTVDNGLHSADSVIAPPHYRNVSFLAGE